MTNRITSTLCAGIAALAVLAMTTSAEARGRGGGSSGEGDSWLRGELQNPQFVQPYGYASPNRMEYRPFYGYGYPYTPYPSRRRTVIEVYPYPY